MPRRARFLLAVLLAIALLAGCSAQEQGGESKEKAAAPETRAEMKATQERTTAEEITAKSAQTVSKPSKGSTEKAAPTANAETTVTVTRVVDGDTIEISPLLWLAVGYVLRSQSGATAEQASRVR